MRPLLLRTLHLAGASAIDAEALERFDAYANDRSGSPLPADLRYDGAGRGGTERGEVGLDGAAMSM